VWEGGGREAAPYPDLSSIHKQKIRQKRFLLNFLYKNGVGKFMLKSMRKKTVFFVL
jgi:hypothetical protein